MLFIPDPINLQNKTGVQSLGVKMDFCERVCGLVNPCNNLCDKLSIP